MFGSCIHYWDLDDVQRPRSVEDDSGLAWDGALSDLLCVEGEPGESFVIPNNEEAWKQAAKTVPASLTKSVSAHSLHGFIEKYHGLFGGQQN